NKLKYKINRLCAALGISSGGYYRWIKPQSLDNDFRIRAEIKQVFHESQKTYGSPRIYKELKSKGINCGRNRIAKYMREDGIVARKRNRYRKPISKQRIKPIANNILNREFTVQEKNCVWASDVSYFWTSKGWIHLAVVMDLYSRKIIGWSMSNRVDKELTTTALQMALNNREPSKDLIHHLDQGAKYTNKAYQTVLKENKTVTSLSQRANYWDNAVLESFFKTIKSKLLKDQRFQTRDEARSAIFDYIEVFYNRNRIHSTLNYVSPVEYERIHSIN
ncbi:MAG: putative transposase, partial [Candidatus Omnitrophota bacterium]